VFIEAQGKRPAEETNMENKEWTVKGWSLPDYNMIHIILQNSEGKEESKTYKQMGSFEKWMMNHGLLVEAIELKCRVEAASLF
jgi:hypothetical protein